MVTRYRALADELTLRMEEGLYPPGTRLPGVRKLASQFGVSVSTVIAAVQLLEDGGRLQARPRSGYFVKPRPQPAGNRLPVSRPPRRPNLVTSQALALELMRATHHPEIVQFGAAVPDTRFYPQAALRRAFARAQRREAWESLSYALPPGVAELRYEVARRLADSGLTVSPDRVVITGGAQEAITLALRTVTEPGDVVAVESPTFYGLLQVLDSLGLRALEIPTDARTGISLPALQLALEQWSVKACVLVPNYSNPIGYLMPEQGKRDLLALLERFKVPLIEDDVYGDLGHGSSRRPPVVKAFDANDTVFLCGSPSKLVSPGLRVGWLLAPESCQDRVEYLKYTLNFATPTIPQLALAELLAHGGLDRHLRRVREVYAEQTARMTDRVLTAFPDGTAVSRPAGGFVLWVQMPPGVDSRELHRQAKEEGISVSPGVLFSATGKYENCIRLNAAVRWDAAVDKALLRLAVMAGKMVG